MKQCMILLIRSTVLLLCCLSMNNFGYSSTKMRLNIDVAQFKDRQDRTYLEIYYSLSQDAIRFIKNDEGSYSCQLIMQMNIYENDSLWANRAWKIEKTVEDTTSVSKNEQIVDVFRYLLDNPTTYKIDLFVKDINQTNSIDSVSTTLETGVFSNSQLEISDVELASSIKRKEETSSQQFVKSLYEVIPNPGALFGEGSSNIYYYYEAYNLIKNVMGRKYKSVAFIKDSYGNKLDNLGFQYRTKTKRHDSSVEIGMINIAELPTGKYVLMCGIADSAETILAAKEKDFFVFNPSVKNLKITIQGGPNFAEGSHGPLDLLTAEQLDEEFEWMLHITTRDDRKFYKNLKNAPAKKKFILSVWFRNRPDERLFGLAYRANYLARVKISDKQFKSVFRPGWKSDRGRVFILYGPPLNVDRFPSTNSKLPYQIWYFDNLKGQGGLQFVFIDRRGFSNYELIHSNLKGELQEPRWESLVERVNDRNQSINQ